MAHHRSLDDLMDDTEHVPTAHPVRTLLQNHFYLDPWVTKEHGMSLLLLSALLFVPYMMAVFFYPVESLLWLAGGLAVVLVVYGAMLLWQRHIRA